MFNRVMSGESDDSDDVGKNAISRKSESVFHQLFGRVTYDMSGEKVITVMMQERMQ